MARAILGSRDGYTNVTESIPLNVRGATAGSIYAAIEALAGTLDNAERLYEQRVYPLGPSVRTIVYRAQGSGTTVAAAILGRAPDDTTSGITLPTNYDLVGNLFYAETELQFQRRGMWIGSVQPIVGPGPTYGTSATVGYPMDRRTVGTQSIFRSVRDPVSLAISGFNSATTSTISEGYLIYASPAVVFPPYAARYGTATGWTDVVGTTEKAYGGNLLRYTPTGTTASTSGRVGTNINKQRLWMTCLLAVRNNSTVTSFQVRANYTYIGGGVSSNYTTVDTSSTLPRLVLLDPVRVSQCATITLTAIAGSATGSFDINTLTPIVIDNDVTSIIAHGSVGLGDIGTATMYVDYNPLYHLHPLMYMAGTSATIAMSYTGNIGIASHSSYHQVTWYATKGTNWLYTNSSNTVVTLTLGGTQFQSFVTPP
jgi:hypothetical protein